MNIVGKKKIVFLGMMSRIPVAGAVWGTMQYLVGLERLGYDVYYVEAHAKTPTMLMKPDGTEDSSALAAEFIDRVMRRFDLGGKWAFHALHKDGRCYGMTLGQLKELYRSAALLINYHGATVPLPEHYATGRLIYLETDPVAVEIEVYDQQEATLAYLEPHCAFFTWGLNYGNPDCQVPLSGRFPFKPVPPVVVCDLWEAAGNGVADVFTTIGNWKQQGEVRFKGEVYTWSKHHEFLKFLEVPRRTQQAFELALGQYDEADRQLLESHGWRVRPAWDFTRNLDDYRRYLTRSRGEFTVAKDQNVRLRSGWFSERSAQYLAAGKPVITQETGFSNVLPTGKGLFGFSSLPEIEEAVASINANYERHCRAARALAREYFSYEVVLRQMMGEMGL